MSEAKQMARKGHTEEEIVAALAVKSKLAKTGEFGQKLEIS
jgi:hypothetical protein